MSTSGHQAQHLQPLFETDQGGELLDDLGIFRVAMKGRARHPEVMPDQEVHDLGVFGRDPEALQHLVRHADAFDRVLLVAPLADVVEQQRQDEQLRPLQLRENAAEAISRGARGRRQPLEVANRQERVLVDGVLVVEVADDAPGDRLEFREHLAEQPGIVHLRQAGRTARAAASGNAAARRARPGWGRNPRARAAAPALLHHRQRGVGDGALLVDGGLKRAQPELGMLPGPGRSR